MYAESCKEGIVVVHMGSDHGSGDEDGEKWQDPGYPGSGSGTGGTRRWIECERVCGGWFVRLEPHLGLVNGGGPSVEVGEGVLFRGWIMSLGSNTLSLS